MSVPSEHLEEAQKLSADGLVDLFQIHLNPTGILYLKLDDTKTWQGKTYEGIGIKMGTVSRSASEEASRPTLQILNYDGLFSSFVRQGVFEKAMILRYRVLSEHVDADVNIFQREMWMVSRVAGLKKQGIQLELRTPSDGPFFVVPARMYMPPEFPTVSMQ